jgi:Ni,Fe-hydrogenase III large subunit/Ni,Fe-hydrogenase III component G
VVTFVPPSLDARAIAEQARARWPDQVRARVDEHRTIHLETPTAELRSVARWLFTEHHYALATVVVEDMATRWDLGYVFYGDGAVAHGQVHVAVQLQKPDTMLPSISADIFAADWHEREAEDLFGLWFEGHPRLGDFVLHNDAWQEGVAPMRRAFDPYAPQVTRQPDADWRPLRLVHAPGAFFMPIGPIFGGDEESAQFLLETVGEDVIRAFPRLFFKYRAVEKIAEGRSIDQVLQLSERFAGTTAFAHSLGYCQAVERIYGTSVPERAQWLRVLLAELERLRHHVGAVERICNSTALAVATSQAAALEEELLRLCGAIAGHRYLFGLNIPGGLSRDLSSAACLAIVHAVDDTMTRWRGLEDRLRFSSSFLDRLEEVGAVSHTAAVEHGLVGPVARASGVARDLRRALPYACYERLSFTVPTEREGDGLARLRQLFAEAEQSAAIIRDVAIQVTTGPIVVALPSPSTIVGGAALGWVEAPRGAAFHWVRIGDDGLVVRYHITPPSFTNWHGFRVAAEDFAFQDFPIIMASFGLSVAECDR